MHTQHKKEVIKAMKKKITIFILSAICLILAACGKKTNDYTVTVKNTEGKAVSGVILAVCDDSTCIPMTTDDKGSITFDGMGKEYVIHYLSAPEDYSFDLTKDYYIGKDGNTLELILENRKKLTKPILN